MTIQQIAELCNTDRRTIERWIDRLSGNGVRRNVVGVVRQNVAPLHWIKQKTMEAARNGTAALFAVEEVLIIVRSGKKKLLADLLEFNLNGRENIRAIEGEYLGPQRLGSDPKHALVPRPHGKEYIIGSFRDGVERLSRSPWWPCNYGVFADALGIKHKLAYHWACKMNFDPENISAENAMSIWCAMSCTPRADPKSIAAAFLPEILGGTHKQIGGIA